MTIDRRSVKISVIIPTFNRVGRIGRAITSVLSQTIQADEIIVIDDGSSDETSSVIEQYFPTVKYFRQRNKGVSSARNAGVRMAKGDWIAFLDSDDEWLPEKLSKQMKALSGNLQMKICHTNEIWYRNGRRVNPKKRHEKVGGYIYRKCLPLCIISPSSVIIHKSIFDEVGLFDESLPVCEDYDLWLRICSKWPVLYFREYLIIKYGGHEDQLSRKYWGMDRFRIRSLEKILSTNHLSDSDRIATVDSLLNKARILRQGAQKRERVEIISEMNLIEDRYREYFKPHINV
jgi:glycosyltransferase involved in cell wall biosynthesis